MITNSVVPMAKALIARALEMTRGNRTKTARELGVDPRTIFRREVLGRPDEVGHQIPR